MTFFGWMKTKTKIGFNSFIGKRCEISDGCLVSVFSKLLALKMKFMKTRRMKAIKLNTRTKTVHSLDKKNFHSSSFMHMFLVKFHSSWSHKTHTHKHTHQIYTDCHYVTRSKILIHHHFF